MSMGPMGGISGSAAGAPLSQTTGSETERAQKDSASYQRQVDKEQQAEQASGIGQTDKDEQTSERDADGRRLWEAPNQRAGDDGDGSRGGTRQSKDATGQSGNHLDLTG